MNQRTNKLRRTLAYGSAPTDFVFNDATVTVTYYMSWNGVGWTVERTRKLADKVAKWEGLHIHNGVLPRKKVI